MIHPLSDVQSNSIGSDTNIWQFCVVLQGAIIGSNCNVCANVLIENDVRIGNGVTVKSGVQIWDGVTIEDNVFIGPNVTFTNDLAPRSKMHLNSYTKTIIKKGASLGANATIVAGNTIGRHAIIGAGAVVTKDVADFELWLGNPAKHVGYITEQGEILDLKLESKKTGVKYAIVNDILKKAND